ncbi:MAG: hypothetical protein P4L49_07695 [Desulfosporosinus sp.]|nr:hypothetical protein [Desulfosporosinus sp.]
MEVLEPIRNKLGEIVDWMEALNRCLHFAVLVKITQTWLLLYVTTCSQR